MDVNAVTRPALSYIMFYLRIFLNVLEAQSKSLCDFASVGTREVQTQDLLISAPLTNHLRRLKTGCKEVAGVESALLPV